MVDKSSEERCLLCWAAGGLGTELSDCWLTLVMMCKLFRLGKSSITLIVLTLGGPENVAMAILSEISVVVNGRNGGMLKYRGARIHEAD